MQYDKLRQLFKNRSNCYADSEEVIQAMDENGFIDTVKEALCLGLLDENKELSYEEKNTIFERAKRIVDSEQLTWKKKYDLIFSHEISQQFDFDYYDPDCGYEDDVRAFMNALEDYMKVEAVVSKF